MPQPLQDNSAVRKSTISQILEKETKQMISLAKAAGTKIFLRIDPRLFDLLQSENYMEYLNNSKKSQQNLKNLYDFVNYINNQTNNTTNNRTFLVNKYSHNIISRFKKSENKLTKNGLKREIRLRRFAIECGFTTWIQFEKMQLFIQQFWNPEYFILEIKFDIESFIKRIKIIFNDKILPLGTFGKLSEDKRKFIFKQINRFTNNIFTEYVFLLPFLKYTLGEKSTDEKRQKTIAFITGSSYYPGKLEIILSDSTASYPFKAQACFYKLYFYKSSPENPQVEINNKNKFIETEINAKKSTQSFGFV